MGKNLNQPRNNKITKQCNINWVHLLLYWLLGLLTSTLALLHFQTQLPQQKNNYLIYIYYKRATVQNTKQNAQYNLEHESQ